MKILSYNIKSNQFTSYLGLLKEGMLGTLRSFTSVFFSFLFPFIFIAIFGVLSYDDIKLNVAVTPDSLKSGILYEALTKVPVLNLNTSKTEEQITDDLNKGRIPASITVKENGTITLSPEIQLSKYSIEIASSAADPNNANNVISIINSVIDSINLSASNSDLKLVDLSQTVVEGRKFQQIDFILPGQLAFALLTGALFGISIKFINYRKQLIFKRFFATPVKKGTIIAAEVTNKAIIAILQALVIVLVGHYVFNFTLANNATTVLDMVILSLVGSFTFLGFGLLIPAISKSEDAVGPVANLIMMPQLFLSGAFFPIEAFPKFLQPIAHILPMTYLTEAFKKVAFEGMPLTSVIPEIGFLILWGVILFTINSFMFKWE